MAVKIDMKTSVASVIAMVGGATAVNAQDWSGAYAGVGVGSEGGWLGNYYSNDDYPDDYHYAGAGSLSGFVGYNIQLDNFVVGAEVSYTGTQLATTQDDGDYDYVRNSMLDVKLRGGIPMGKALIFGFAGLSVSTQYLEDDYVGMGLNFGGGVDYQLTDSFFVGAEYTGRLMTGHYETGSYDSTIGFRAGMRF